MRNKTTLTDLYLGYRFKYRDLNAKSVPMWPYIRKEDISTHEYKLDKNQWKAIIKCYFELVIEYLLEGHPFKIPHGMGVLQMRKSKSYPPDRQKSKLQGKLIVHKNLHTDGYRPLLKWYRNKNTGCSFKFMNYYKFNFTPFIWKMISKRLFESPSLIYKFNDE